MSHFNTTPLDPARLATPFQAQTSWYVLTGAACTGKTTLLEMLAGRGFQVVAEGARQLFDQELAHGHSLAEIRADDWALQREIAAFQVQLESQSSPERVTFLDRALPDSLTFYRVFGMDPNEVLPVCFCHRYAGVFLLERLPLHRDQTLGPEDDLTSDFLNEWLERDYAALGYDVVRVPVLPPEERLLFMLENLNLAVDP